MNEPTTRTKRLLVLLGIVVVLFLFAAFVWPFIQPDSYFKHEPGAGNYCRENLRLIDGSKQQWALEHHKAQSDVVMWDDIKAYLKPYLKGRKNQEVPECPLGGTYSLGTVSNAPACSIHGRLL
jgi:hypothetical protein